MLNSSYESAAYQSTMSDAQIATLIGVTILITLIIVAFTYILISIFLGMIFKKAGIASWKAWVPVYNSWITLEMGGQQGWLSLLQLIPGMGIVTTIFLYIAMYHISTRFGKDGTMFIMIALIVPPVWYIWLAVDKTAVWQKSVHS